MNIPYPKKMKAIYLIGNMKMEVREIPTPEVLPGGALLKVHSSGLCGSDINRFRFTSSDEEKVIGHEAAGQIVAVGAGVTVVSPGDRVVIGHVHIPCGYCVYCRHGSPAMCHKFKESKVIPGGYAQFISLSSDHLAHTVIKIPSGVSYAEATFVDPLACCIRAIKHAAVQPFDKVVVLGAGIMGQLFVQLLRELNAKTLVLDISDYRLAKAKTYQADYIFNSKQSNLVDKVLSATDNIGADVVLLSYVTQDILDQSFGYVRDGGKVCIFAPPIREFNLCLNFYEFFRRELSMYGSYSSTISDLEATMAYIASKKIEVQSLITQYSDLDHMQSVMENLDDKQLKVIIKPNLGMDD